MKSIVLIGIFLFALQAVGQESFQVRLGSGDSDLLQGAVRVPDGNVCIIGQNYDHAKITVLAPDGQHIRSVGVSDLVNDIVYPSSLESFIASPDGSLFFTAEYELGQILIQLDPGLQLGFVRNHPWSEDITWSTTAFVHPAGILANGDIAFCAPLSDKLLDVYRLTPSGSTVWGRTLQSSGLRLIPEEALPQIGGIALALTTVDDALRYSTSVVTLNADGSVRKAASLRDVRYLDSAVDADGRILLTCRLVSNQSLIVICLDSDLNKIWAKNVHARIGYFSWNYSNISVSQNGELTISLPKHVDQRFGQRLIKFSRDGDYLLGRMLLDLDATASGYLFDYDENFSLLTYSQGLVRMLDKQLQPTDCNVIDLCLEVTDYDFSLSPLTFTTTDARALENTLTFSVFEIEDSTIRACTPLDFPDASFTTNKLQYCAGDTIHVTGDIYPIGLSSWTFQGKYTLDTLSGKSNIYTIAPDADSVLVIHTLRLDDCSYMDSVKVGVYRKPKAALPGDTTTCATVVQLAIDQVTYPGFSWDDGFQGADRAINTTGSYICSTVDENGCQAKDTLNALFLSVPDLQLGTDTILCTGDRIVFDPFLQPGDIFTWDDGNAGMQRSFEFAHTLSATLMNQCGSDRDTIHVEVDDCGVLPVLPNVFSPNGDGINDIYEIRFKTREILSATIFDRWGNQLYHATGEVVWDGTDHGRFVNSGVYLLLLKTRHLATQSILSQSQTVTLLR